MTDNVIDILKRIREGALDPKKISASDRRVCVAYLRLEGYRQEEIAQIFKVHRLTIIRDEKANRKDAAKLVDEIDVKSFAGNLIAWANNLTAKALREGDYGLAWKIKRGLLSDLQSLGLLPRSAEQLNVQIDTFVELVRHATKKVDAEVIESGASSKNELPPAPKKSIRVRKKKKCKRKSKES